MNEFTASNGIRVEYEEATDRVDFTDKTPTAPIWFGDGEFQALREFFQHERDEQLGRWRFPRDPQFVVYPGYSPGEEQRIARVVHEHTGVSTVVYESDGVGRSNHPAARAYFEAHPEPKSWHEAKPGEVWVLELPEGPRAMLSDPAQFTDGNEGIDFDHPDISAARRIWPESL